MFKKIFSYVRCLLSEPDGSPSSTRVLMYLFSLFTMHLIWGCFRHIYTLTDSVQVSVWLGNMPMLITALIGLIALPYGINKTSATFSDIAAMASGKKPENNFMKLPQISTPEICDTCGKPKSI